MSDRTFSYRWGVEILDGGFTSIPNLFLDHYAEAGITRSEFLVIVHMARYAYERPDSECRPSLATVARQTGYSVRYVRKLLAELEKRGLLERHYRRGNTTIYDFTRLSQAILDAWRRRKGKEPGDTSEPQFRGTPEPQFPPPRNPSSAEQQEERTETNNNSAAGASVWEQRQIVAALTGFGITPTAARDLAPQCSLCQVQGWIRHAKDAPGLTNPQGLVVKNLRAGEQPPTLPVSPAAEAPGGVFS